ncbi:MAG: hypothetical protein EAZ39_23465 [Oscillatoriales cyanobacterium]|nr:MAG: hypothetical protein EAZ45_04880 [Oscillatoriales cyanobacterium]TAG14757.1 MAG: hypothetical protein EAZ39_23465 [Oscillatoriales cyanobacterium]TAG43131.1 MAG: hypothetical protein EAZ33_13505 [Oscillatoriales cyanobacterium]
MGLLTAAIDRMSGSVLIVSCEQASDRSRVKSKASLTLRRFFAVARYSPVRDLAPAFDWRQSAPKNSCEGPRNYFLEFFW